MLMLARSVLALFGFLTGWYVSYWTYFAGFELDGRPFLGRGVPFLIGLVLAAFILAATSRLQHGFISSTVLGAIALGSIGFVAGFFGPMLLDPEGNQGPLLGLLITGPLGFLLGGPLGALWWWQRRRRSAG